MSRLCLQTYRNIYHDWFTTREKGKDIKLTQGLLGARSADPDAMQEDGADGTPLTKTTTNNRSITKQKADRVAKKAAIQRRKAAPKPANAMRFSAKKKTRKGGK